jgi:cell division transport system permease protein
MGIASIFVLTSCLILVGAFGLLIHNIDINLEKLGSLNEIVVFLDYELTKEDIDTIGQDIQKLDNVSHLERIKKVDAFEDMKGKYPEYEELFAEMEERGDNPLADSFVVTYIDAETVHDLEYAIQTIEGVRTVNNRLDYAVTIANFKNIVSLVFIWFFVLLLSVSVFVIFNTIKLAVHSRQTEISIMRYIGATKKFIITPFILEGIFIGIISSVLAFGTDAIIYSQLVKKATLSIQMIELSSPGSVNIIMLLAFIAIGVITGSFASFISLRKNLKH